MINPVFLRTFVTLAEAKSFTRTAELLRMTQPGVSQHLRWLEDYFGVPLASRDGRVFTLTDAGHRLVAYGQALFREHDEFRASLATDDPHAGLCRFASPGSFGLGMYDFLLALNRKHPGLAIHFVSAPNPSIVRDVVDEKIDVGFVTKLPEDAAVVATEMEGEKLCLVVPASLKKITWPALVALGFIDHPDGHHHASRLLSRNFPKDYQGMAAFAVKGFSNQIARILEPVALGLGFTALPEYACRAFPNQKAIRLARLATDVVDPIYWIQKRGRQLPARFAFIRAAKWPRA
jgi:DNA-binding transcriptional LysR family regulator